MLHLREKEIFETLKKIKKFEFVVIGGYAVNCYTLPRFSVDCDIVIKENNRLIGKILLKEGYKLVESASKFLRYEKTISKGFKVGMDVLVGEVFDRQTNSVFAADWIFNNSSLSVLKGKTITDEIKLRVIDIDALIVIKLVSCRSADIRDVFMLMPQAKDKKWIKKEISERINFLDRFSNIKERVISSKFKDDLQGVYGYIDPVVFEKHKKAVLELGKIIKNH